MELVTKILPDTFEPLRTSGLYIGPDYLVEFSIGDVQVEWSEDASEDNRIHYNAALRTEITFTIDKSKRSIVFKNEGMVKRTTEWLFMQTSGDWSLKQSNWLEINIKQMITNYL